MNRLPEPDTIAAIATASGAAGVGIIRISGPNAFDVAAKLTRHSQKIARQKSHTLRYVTLYNAQNESLDDVLLAVFRAPRSLTGENVVEIQGHGGTVHLSRLLGAVLEAGARTARPGEFSERAFLNGKMDLTQAEAIAELVEAQTVLAARAARRHVSGDLSRRLQICADDLKESLARIEASIDFPEEVGEADPDVVDAPLDRTAQNIAALLTTAPFGRRLQTGVSVALTGRPNVGKSSLMNALAGFERAIVSPIPGTTRDVVEEALNVQGIPVRLLDTAGLRETGDVIEQIGVERARRAVGDADVIIVVLEASAGVTSEDKALLRGLDKRNVVVCVNKSDEADPAPTIATASQILPHAIVVSTSAVTGAGLPALADALVHAATGRGQSEMSGDALLITSARHEAALQAAQTHLRHARETLRLGLPLELVAVDVHGTLASLGEITGETVREAIIAGIFARFCLGK